MTTFYCIFCFKTDLPIGMTCPRSQRGEHTAICLRCCDHNHG